MRRMRASSGMTHYRHPPPPSLRARAPFVGGPQRALAPSVCTQNCANVSPNEVYSRKVFVGGLPFDSDEDEISATFSQFGPLRVDWPHKNQRRSHVPPKGFAFLVFEHEMSVQLLVASCVTKQDELYMVVSSPTTYEKAVQVRPFRLADADFVPDADEPLDPRKALFVGGVPRQMTAAELAAVMQRLFGRVLYAGIDTDLELKYPKGAARVVFAHYDCYLQAVRARYAQLLTGKVDKRAEVKPYTMDSQPCDECGGVRSGGRWAPLFCDHPTCLQYYCDACWLHMHRDSAFREFHKPMNRNKPPADADPLYCFTH